MSGWIVGGGNRVIHSKSWIPSKPSKIIFQKLKVSFFFLWRLSSVKIPVRYLPVLCTCIMCVIRDDLNAKEELNFCSLSVFYHIFSATSPLIQIMIWMWITPKVSKHLGQPYFKIGKHFHSHCGKKNKSFWNPQFSAIFNTPQFHFLLLNATKLVAMMSDHVFCLSMLWNNK